MKINTYKVVVILKVSLLAMFLINKTHTGLAFDPKFVLSMI